MTKGKAKSPQGNPGQRSPSESHVEQKWIDPSSTTSLGHQQNRGWKTEADLPETNSWRLPASYTHCSGKHSCSPKGI